MKCSRLDMLILPEDFETSVSSCFTLRFMSNLSKISIIPIASLLKKKGSLAPLGNLPNISNCARLSALSNMLKIAPSVEEGSLSPLNLGK